MAATSEGGKKAAKTNRKLYGEDFYKEIGAIGGRKKVPKGFALMTKAQRSAAGRLGGRKSTRSKSKKG